MEKTFRSESLLPEILILLSSYNGQDYIEEQIKSILKQTNVITKILIRDDGSTDNTINIIEKIQSEYPDRIEYVQGVNLGFAESFSRLIKLAHKKYNSIDYFAFSDQDDIWLPEKLKKAYDKIKNDNYNGPILYCSDLIVVDKDLNRLNYKIRKSNHKTHKFINKYNCLVQNYSAGCTMLFNKATVEKYNKLNPSNIFYHDYFIYKLCMFLGKVYYDNNSYILYRQHGKNQVGAKNFIDRTKKRMELNWLHAHPIENQNRSFLEVIRNELNSTDIKLLEDFCNYNQKFINKLRLLTNRKIRYSSLSKDLMYRIRIILGTV